MPEKGYMMEIYKGNFYDVLPLFLQTNGELVTAYRRGEENAQKGVYYKIPRSENWFTSERGAKGMRSIPSRKRTSQI